MSRSHYESVDIVIFVISVVSFITTGSVIKTLPLNTQTYIEYQNPSFWLRRSQVKI